MDKYIAGTMRRVGVSVVVLASLSFALLTQKVYHQSPTDRYVSDEHESGCLWPPAPMRIVVPWLEDGRMSLIQGVTAAAMDLQAAHVAHRPGESVEDWLIRSELASRIKLVFPSANERLEQYRKVLSDVPVTKDLSAFERLKRWTAALGQDEPYYQGDPRQVATRLRHVEDPLITVEFVDEPDAKETDNALARSIAERPDVSAVIGHERSRVAVASAVAYEDAGILYLSPKATLARLTRHRFKYAFRMVPSDDAFAETLAAYTKHRDWNRVGVIYARFEQGEALAREFAAHLRKAWATQSPEKADDGETTLDADAAPDATRDLKLAYFRSYLPSPRDAYARTDHRELLEEVTKFEVDALLLADQFPWAAKMMRDMREMGMTQPVLGGELLDSSQAWQRAGEAADNLYVATVVDPQSKSQEYMEFQARFREHFSGLLAGYGSVQGYEAFNLLFNAIVESKCTNPLVLATTLRTTQWEGMFGNYHFDNTNAIIGRDIYIKKVYFMNGRGSFSTIYPPKPQPKVSFP
tara:strand:+ start:11377 stop:12948 length:1572 start_codon:yes stop_codon:yes gene_type:complete